MKNKKHGKENIIGKIIYGFLLFMPLLAIFITCAYAIFNKNAYKSYYGVNINDETHVQDDLSNINTNQYVYLNTQDYSVSNAFNIYANNFELINSGTLSTSKIEQFSQYNKIRIYCRTTSAEFYGINNDNSYTWIDNNSNFTCKFKITNYSNTPNANNGFYTIIYNENTFLSEVFYYSIDKVEESPLFNWANNTTTYTVLETTCTTLGITTSFIPMLLSYWLMTSLMYLLYDIALLVVNMAHNRIHDVESSI